MTGTLVIGAGQAAASLAIKLRALGYDADITIFGQEPTPPYQRPPLSKAFLLGDLTEDRLLLRPAAFWADNNISLRLEETATQVDVAGKTVTTDKGATLSFEHLVFATGATPRRLPDSIGGALGNVFCIRGKNDVAQLAPQMKPGKKLVVIGGGYIGLEAAAVARKLDMDVTLIEAQPRILQRVAAQETSDYFRKLHQDNGVNVLENTPIQGLVGDQDVSGVALQDGSVLTADLVITGIGVTPNAEIAEAAGIKVLNGILTDDHCRTSADNIWAIGDCASFAYRGETIRLESVGNAIDSGDCVAANIAGTDTPYVPKPWFWSDQYDTKLQIAGLNLGYTEVITRDDSAGAGLSFWYYQDDTLIAVDSVGDRKAYLGGKKMIETGISPLKSDVADVTKSVKELMLAG